MFPALIAAINPLRFLSAVPAAGPSGPGERRSRIIPVPVHPVR
jgi:hypothetical protein